MRKYRVLLSKNAYGDIARLDKSVGRRIIRKLDYFESLQDPLSLAKRLRNVNIAQYRFRVGNYRVFFDVNNRGEIIILYVLSVRHRREAY